MNEIFELEAEIKKARELSHAMAALIEKLPLCDNETCNKLAIGYWVQTRKIIGRKSYGGKQVPCCAMHGTDKQLILFPYHQEAKQLDILVQNRLKETKQ